MQYTAWVSGGTFNLSVKLAGKDDAHIGGTNPPYMQTSDGSYNTATIYSLHLKQF